MNNIQYEADSMKKGMLIWRGGKQPDIGAWRVII
jgi:hypothetical protein